jgi:hypothetical protein
MRLVLQNNAVHHTTGTRKLPQLTHKLPINLPEHHRQCPEKEDSVHQLYKGS